MFESFLVFLARGIDIFIRYDVIFLMGSRRFILHVMNFFRNMIISFYFIVSKCPSFNAVLSQIMWIAGFTLCCQI